MRKKFSYFSICISLFLVSSSFAQTTTTTAKPDFPPSYYDIVAMFLLAIIIISFIAIVYYEGRKGVAEEEVLVKQPSAFAKFRRAITKTTPVETENDIIIRS